MGEYDELAEKKGRGGYTRVGLNRYLCSLQNGQSVGENKMQRQLEQL